MILVNNFLHYNKFNPGQSLKINEYFRLTTSFLIVPLPSLFLYRSMLSSIIHKGFIWSTAKILPYIIKPYQFRSYNFTNYKANLCVITKSAPIFYNKHPVLYVGIDGTISPDILAIPTTLFLPSYPKSKKISGLLNLTQVEEDLFLGDSALSLEFCKITNLLLAKVIIHFSYETYPNVSECLKIAIPNILGAAQKLTMSKELTKIFWPRIIPFLQHYITLFWSGTNFSFETLKTLCGKEINCDTYEGTIITPITMIELHALIVLKNIKRMPDAKYFLIHPENSSKLLVYYNPIISKEQTGQRYADFLISKTHDQVKFYYDFKSFLSMDVNHCRFFLCHLTERLANRLINDLLVSLQEVIARNSIRGDILQDLYEEFRNLKNEKINYKLKFEKIMRKCAEIGFDENQKQLKISIGWDAGTDMLFDTISARILEKDAVLEKYNDSKRLFKKQQVMEKEETSECINDFINNCFAEDVREQLKENFKKITAETFAIQ